MDERLQLLRERYYIFVGPLLILFAVGAGNKTSALAWVAGGLLILLTINWLVGFLRRELGEGG